MASVTDGPFAAISPSWHAGLISCSIRIPPFAAIFLPSLIATSMTYFLPLTRREGREIAANGGNPAWHDGEIAANGETVTDAIFPFTALPNSILIYLALNWKIFSKPLHMLINRTGPHWIGFREVSFTWHFWVAQALLLWEVSLHLGQVLEERRLSVVEEVSSGGEDPNVSADPGSVVVRARPILATMQSSSSDGQDTVVIAESTLQGNVSIIPRFCRFCSFWEAGCFSRVSSQTMVVCKTVLSNCHGLWNNKNHGSLENSTTKLPWFVKSAICHLPITRVSRYKTLFS